MPLKKKLRNSRINSTSIFNRYHLIWHGEYRSHLRYITLDDSTSVMGSLDQLLGAGLTALGALITVCGLNLMKFHNIQMNNKDKSKKKKFIFCTFSFLRGLITFCVGQIIMISGTYFATVSVCSATANIAVGFNAIIAWKYFHEKFYFFLPPLKKKIILNVTLSTTPLTTSQSPLLSSSSSSSWHTRCQQVQEWHGLGVLCMLVGAALVVIGAPTLDDKHGVPMTFNETTEFSFLFTKIETIMVNIIIIKNKILSRSPNFCSIFLIFLFDISIVTF